MKKAREKYNIHLINAVTCIYSKFWWEGNLNDYSIQAFVSRIKSKIGKFFVRMSTFLEYNMGVYTVSRNPLLIHSCFISFNSCFFFFFRYGRCMTTGHSVMVWFLLFSPRTTSPSASFSPVISVRFSVCSSLVSFIGASLSRTFLSRWVRAYWLVYLFTHFSYPGPHLSGTEFSNPVGSRLSSRLPVVSKTLLAILLMSISW